jgi:hypothetical protein
MMIDLDRIKQDPFKKESAPRSGAWAGGYLMTKVRP